MATYLAVRAEAATGTSLSIKVKFVIESWAATSGNACEGFYNEFIFNEERGTEICGLLIFEADTVNLDSFTSVDSIFTGGYCMLG